AVIDDVVRSALGEVVAVLDGGDRHDLPGALDLVEADLREADVPDQAAAPLLLDGLEGLLERRLGVDPMQVPERDAVRPQPLQALLDLRPKRLRAPLTGAVPALCRDDAAGREWGEGGPDRLLALASGVDVGRVDVAHSHADRLLHERHVPPGVG